MSDPDGSVPTTCFQGSWPQRVCHHCASLLYSKQQIKQPGHWQQGRIHTNVAGAQWHKSTQLWVGPNRPDSRLTKSKGRETSDGEMRKEFISVRPIPGTQQTSISKTVSNALQILPGLQEENMRQKSVGTCRWAVDGQDIIVTGGGLLAHGSPNCLRGQFWFLSGDVLPTGSFA